MAPSVRSTPATDHAWTTRRARLLRALALALLCLGMAGAVFYCMARPASPPAEVAAWLVPHRHAWYALPMTMVGFVVAVPGAGPAPDRRDRHRLRSVARAAVRDGRLPGQRVVRVCPRPMARAPARRTLGRSRRQPARAACWRATGRWPCSSSARCRRRSRWSTSSSARRRSRYREFVDRDHARHGRDCRLRWPGSATSSPKPGVIHRPRRCCAPACSSAIPLTAAWLINRRLRRSGQAMTAAA